MFYSTCKEDLVLSTWESQAYAKVRVGKNVAVMSPANWINSCTTGFSGNLGGHASDLHIFMDCLWFTLTSMAKEDDKISGIKTNALNSHDAFKTARALSRFGRGLISFDIPFDWWQTRASFVMKKITVVSQCCKDRSCRIEICISDFLIEILNWWIKLDLFLAS